LENHFNIEVASLIIGGGNSRFLMASKDFHCKTILLTPSHLKAEGVSSDIIQLLGCHANVVNTFNPEQLIPPFKELEARCQQAQNTR
jgi:hypothetical protein